MSYDTAQSRYYRRWYEKNKANRNRLVKNEQYAVIWQKENPEKKRAQNAVHNALRCGKMTRPTKCESCLDECKPHAHHYDYSKPLDVFWLCASCHKLQHNGWKLVEEIVRKREQIIIGS